MRTMATEAPIPFKDGYWKPYSYYEKLFARGNVLTIVYRNGTKETWQIETQEFRDENLSKPKTDVVLTGYETENVIAFALFSERPRKYSGVYEIELEYEVQRLVVKPSKDSTFPDVVTVKRGYQPLEIPSEYRTITLKKGTRLYRRANKMEPLKKRKYVYYYADDPLFNFNGVGKIFFYPRTLNTNTGVYEGDNGIYEYALSKDVQVVDLTTNEKGQKVWRCNIYSNDSDPNSSEYRAVDMDCESNLNYQSALIEACKRRDCVGFRAYVKVDNGSPDDFSEDVYAEVALLGSAEVVRIDCLRKDDLETSDTKDKINNMKQTIEGLWKTESELDELLRKSWKENDALKKELEELKAGKSGGGSSESMKRKRENYLHL